MTIERSLFDIASEAQDMGVRVGLPTEIELMAINPIRLGKATLARQMMGRGLRHKRAPDFHGAFLLARDKELSVEHGKCPLRNIESPLQKAIRAQIGAKGESLLLTSSPP